MTSIVNTNMASLTAQRNLGMNQATLATAMQRLSSGLRINSAKDDAAGLAISERMGAQVRGANQAARNANDGISLAQTAEGDMAQIGSNLQRMRELAVQSSNATNTASDRKLLDGEVQALSAEIDRVAQNSSFNGVKLLDGSFASQGFQVGANGTANDVIQISSIASARTSVLGGVGTSFAATATGGVTTAALAAGDLTLNGFQVGASELGAAPGQSTASAYSIATAINKIQADSGVTATANSNTVTGSGPTAGAVAADVFSINGINVGAIKTGTTAAGQGANVAAAINAISNQTGVTATASATDGTLSLTAADGRDISIAMNGTAADAATAAANKAAVVAQTGLATGVVGTQANETTAVSFGTYTTLSSGTGTDEFALTIDSISVFSNVASTTVLDAAYMQGKIDLFAAANTATHTVTGTVAGGDLTITKLDGTASDVTLTSEKTGANGVDAAGAISGGFSGIVSSVGSAPTADTTAAGAGTGTVAAAAAANHGTVTLSSTSANGIVYGGAAADKAGLSAAGDSVSATTTSSVSSIASLNVLTAASATSALSAIDGALGTVNASRAALGAYQNRFTSVVTSLQTTSENLTAARSRIQDADFASETAALSRSQILQQAGTAMVAQANQLPQGVLALLR